MSCQRGEPWLTQLGVQYVTVSIFEGEKICYILLQLSKATILLHSAASITLNFLPTFFPLLSLLSWFEILWSFSEVSWQYLGLCCREQYIWELWKLSVRSTLSRPLANNCTFKSCSDCGSMRMTVISFQGVEYCSGRSVISFNHWQVFLSLAAWLGLSTSAG